MELSYNFIHGIQNMVLEPNFSTATTVFFFSAVNEFFSILPYVIILSGQLVFIPELLSISLFFKLLLFVAIPVGIGAAIGSSFIYGVAYAGGKPAIDKFGKYMRLSWNDIDELKSKFKGTWYDEVFFLSLRVIPFLPSFPLSAAVGILRMSPTSYLILTALGFTLRMMISFILMGLGIEAMVQ